jgi:hypothetical protein
VSAVFDFFVFPTFLFSSPQISGTSASRRYPLSSFLYPRPK